MKSALRFRMFVAALPVVGLIVAPTTAIAASAVTHGLHPYQGLFNGTSSNWSGYAAHGAADSFNSVSAAWVQPAGLCTSNTTYSAFWVGLDGYTSQTVEQTGSEVDCKSGSPKYYAWYEMYPAPSFKFGGAVSAGDHFRASVTSSGDDFTLTISDTTKGWQQTLTEAVSSAEKSSAEVIAEAPCCTAADGILPLTDFGTVKFNHAIANGSAIGNSNPSRIVMRPAGGPNTDNTSQLSKDDKFTVTWAGN